MPYRRKKRHCGDTYLSKKCKTKRRTKDLDEIDNDLTTPGRVDELLNQEVDLDVPGGGQHYCVCCARHFVDNHSLMEHVRSKVHKRRLKSLEVEPYTVRESELAAGMGSYVRPCKRKRDDPNSLQTPNSPWPAPHVKDHVVCNEKPNK